MEETKKAKKKIQVFPIVNAIIMILLVIITLYPVLNTLAISLNDGTDALRGGIYLWPRKFTWKNYITVLQKDNLLTGAYITVSRTIIGTVLALVSNAILAFIISRKRFLFKRGLSLFWVITMYVNGGMIPTFLLYKGLGLTNSFAVYVIPGMVSAFNMLVGFLPPVARFSAGIILIIALHGLNIFLSFLGAYVHGLRLQFVEFFGKFYEGGGRALKPFKTYEKYIDIKHQKSE